jgi:hypothetical protein
VVTTVEEQREIIVELLRTRNLGGGMQGVMEWRGKVRPESEIPLSGDHFKQAFGVPTNGPGSSYREADEASSREALEKAIEKLRDYDLSAYIAIQGVFDRDVGGYGDLEFFGERAPELAAHAHRGIALLTAMLPPDEYRLYVDKPLSKEHAKAKTDFKTTSKQAIADTWARRKGEGAKSKEVVAEIRGTYGISERRVYQILQQMESPSEEETPNRGRPRKEKA